MGLFDDSITFSDIHQLFYRSARVHLPAVGQELCPKRPLSERLGQVGADRLRHPLALPPFRRVLPSSRHRLPWPEPPNAFEDGPKEPSGHGHLGHLEDHVPGVSNHLRTDLDEFLP